MTRNRGAIAKGWIVVALLVFGWVGAPVAVAQAPAASPLLQLPSPAGPHIPRLKDLAPGQWLDLGPPAPDPRWGRAQGRAWTSSMRFAPSLQAAFLFGEGVHGWWNRETGRYMDDLWLYDVMAHRWINAYPGTDTRSPPELMINADGFVSDSQGNPVPIATMVHGYEMTAWDPVRRQFMSMPNGHAYFKDALPSVYAFLFENQQRINQKQASPWIFSLDRGTWQRKKTNTDSPSSTHGDVLLYIPPLDAMLFRSATDIWFYDIDANIWRRAAPVGPQPPTRHDATACYDPKRNRVYLGGGGYPNTTGPNALWILEIGPGRWIDPAPGGYPVGVSYGTNTSMLHCDLTNDKVLLFRHKGDDRGVFAYDPDANTWQKVAGLPAFWREDAATQGSSGFFAETLNVHLFHVAGDSYDNGRILAYRYGP